MRLACQSDFYNGPVYTNYPPPDEVYDKRARLFYYYPEPILVVGCGFGGLVRAFRDLNKQAWGIDASQWAIDNREKRVEKRVFKFDILDLSGWTLGQMGTVINQDVWPHMTEDEVLVAARNSQALAPFVINMVTEKGEDKGLTYHTTGYWMSLTGQLTVSLEGM
jgi:predicted TPR repeat methyltransferase